eukprot:15328269-Ditylum_brightwellii.AAC.1
MVDPTTDATVIVGRRDNDQTACCFFVSTRLTKIGIAPIAQLSYKQELKHYHTALVIASTIKENPDTKIFAILLIYNSFDMHTVVCYNVGYHVDVFHQSMPSLENKAVFCVASRAQVCSVDNEICCGGCTYVGDYHYALLNWGRRARRCRCAAIDAGIIQKDERLTHIVLTQYFHDNPDQQEAFNAAVNANMAADTAN